MRKLGIVAAFCLLAIYGLARAADVENPFRPPATTCTNQFIRSLAVLTGVGTCATVNFASDGMGIVPAASGGAGTVNGALKGNGSGAVSQAACADLSNGTGMCSASFVTPTAWTPADGSGASLVFTSVNATYTRVVNTVIAQFTVTYPSTVSGANATISGLPITSSAQTYVFAPSLCYSLAGIALGIQPGSNATTATFFNITTGGAVINSTLTLKTIYCTLIYTL